MNQNSTQDTLKKNGNKGKKRVFRITALVLLAVAGILTLYQFGPLKSMRKKEQPKPIAVGDVFPGENKEAAGGYPPDMRQDEIEAYLQEPKDEENARYLINFNPVFKNGKSAGDLAIGNPRYSAFPIVVQIFLKETGEIIYDSGGLLPDRHIDEAKLLKNLKAGAYEATAEINIYDPVTNIWQGKAQETLTVTIQN